MRSKNRPVGRTHFRELPESDNSHRRCSKIFETKEHFYDVTQVTEIFKKLLFYNIRRAYRKFPNLFQISALILSKYMGTLEMKIQLVTSVSIALSGLAFHEAQADVRFECWKPNELVMTQNEWTADRFTNAIPEEEIIPEEDGGTLDAVPTRADVRVEPYKFGGKLYYRRDGHDRSASAQFVAEDNIIITAAHAMLKNGKASNITFRRAVDNSGGTQFGIDFVSVLTAWIPVSTDPPSPARAAVDYAILKTTTGSLVGHFSLGKDQVFSEATIMGYPARPPFSGEEMYKSDVVLKQKIGNAYEAGASGMTQGASGGAWFIKKDDEYLAVSSVAAGSSQRVYGPAYDDVTSDMIAFVTGDCK